MRPLSRATPLLLSAGLLLAAQLVLAAPGRAAAPRAEEPSRDAAARLLGGALSEGVAYQRLAELTDTIGPRLSGSPGYDAAVRWAREKLEQDGLTVRLEKVMVPHWVRGEERAEVVALDGRPAHPLAITALGGSAGTPEGGLTAEVIEARSFDELRALGERARGKIVLFTHTMASPEDYGRFGALRFRGATEVAKVGGVGMLVRSLAIRSLRSPHTGAMHRQEDLPRLPAAALATEDAELLQRLLARGPVRVRLTLGCRTLPDAEAANVVAELRGRERPEEVVLLTAHLDSWDLGTGAEDDGAGIVIVMEAARQIARLPRAPRRTVRVALVANEENGLRGAEAYAKAHAAELPRHVAALESDAGSGKALGLQVLAGEGGTALVESFVAPLANLGIKEVAPSTRALGADLIPLLPAQVPMVGVRQDMTAYFDVHHSAADTFDKVNPRTLAENAAAMAWLAYALAESPRTLARPPPPPPPEKPAAAK